MGSNVSGNSLTINLNSLRQLVSYNISEKSPKPDLTTIIEYPRQLSSTLLNNHICIYKALCLSVYPLRFVLPLGDKHCPHTVGGANISHTQGWGKHFDTQGGQTFLHNGGKHFTQGGWQTFCVGGGGSNDDVDGKEEDVSEASKLSAGARIFRGRRARKF